MYTLCHMFSLLKPIAPPAPYLIWADDLTSYFTDKIDLIKRIFLHALTTYTKASVPRYFVYSPVTTDEPTTSTLDSISLLSADIAPGIQEFFPLFHHHFFSFYWNFPISIKNVVFSFHHLKEEDLPLPLTHTLH